MTNPVTFDAYLRYVRWQSAPAEAQAVRAWLSRPANASLAHAWMHQYTQLLPQETSPARPLPDFDALQDQLLARLQLRPAPARPMLPQATGLARLAHCFSVPFLRQEFLGLRAFFHRLHWQ